MLKLVLVLTSHEASLDPDLNPDPDLTSVQPKEGWKRVWKKHPSLDPNYKTEACLNPRSNTSNPGS